MSQDSIKIMPGSFGGFVVLRSPSLICGDQGEIMFAGDLDAVLEFVRKHFTPEAAK